MIIGFIIAGVALLATAFMTIDEAVEKREGRSKLYIFCCYVVGALETAVGTVFLIRAVKELIAKII